ncbi:hypothetical protein ACIO53_03975 [Streptomyces sp. NPDC087305]|uniref:hypothetical protein n=1 Tax=Streptomyces sp. NPDC087305 TaxID=3365781 RepID=UPI0037FC8AAE
MPLDRPVGLMPIQVVRRRRCRTVAVLTGWATTGTRFPPTEPDGTITRRQRTEPLLPMRTIHRSFRPAGRTARTHGQTRPRGPGGWI